MSSLDALRIVPSGAEPALSRDQKRFNTLVRQIEQARSALKAWQDSIAQYGLEHAQVVAPLQTKLRATLRRWVFALHGLLAERRWSSAERETMVDMMCDAAGELLADDADDAELRSLYSKHGEVDFETERQEALQALKNLTESMTGLNLGDEENISSEEDLRQRIQRRMQEKLAAEEAQAEARTTKRRKTAAQQKREDEALQVTQSVREVFRKLASALHPDRETDDKAREAKTALMQEVNQAYARNDLLALLELQLRIEQVDAGHMAHADAKRVRHYNKVLAEQLDEIKTELNQVELNFRMNFGLEPGWGLNPKKLGALLKQHARDLEEALAKAEHEIGMFADTAATKRWVKDCRKMMREDEMSWF